MKNLFHPSAALTLAKAALLFPVFFWLQACAQSPAPNTSAPGQKSSILNETAVSLGNSPDEKYRLFKNDRKNGEAIETEFVIVRFQDMKEMLLAKLPSDTSKSNNPKYYWSKDSTNLLLESAIVDSISNREVVLFNLPTFDVAQRNKGTIIGFDAINQVVFYYRTTAERQSICFIDLKNPKKEFVRDIIAAPSGKLPSLIFSYKERRVKVKAYTTEDTPLNVALLY